MNNTSTSTNQHKRTFLVPYMGDFSNAASAALRHYGINSYVLPTNTEQAYEFAGKHIYTETCFPLKGVVGDTLSFLHQERERLGKEEVENRYLVAFPTTSGPCRFGKYHEVLRQFLDKEGFENVPVTGPTSETDYTDILGEGFTLRDELSFYRLTLKAVATSDLLDDLVLRYRPYARDPQEVNRRKDEQLEKLENILEDGGELRRLRSWAEETLETFRQFDGENRYPLVLFAGEIYMRKHDPYNGHVIEKLEQKGLETVRTPVMEWIEYVNKINTRQVLRNMKWAVRQADVKRFFRELGRFALYTSNYRYMCRVERKIAEPAHHAVADRHNLPDPETLIHDLESAGEFHGQVTGESPLSIGVARYLMNEDGSNGHEDGSISGMFHIGPFTCMQEGVATAKIESLANQIRQNKPDTVFPVLHGFFGDSPNPNLEAEIAVFAEQCYQKRELQDAKN